MRLPCALSQVALCEDFFEYRVDTQHDYLTALADLIEQAQGLVNKLADKAYQAVPLLDSD